MKKILFSAFDAGGGNAVFPVAKEILKNKSFKALILIGGPSKEIFKREKIKHIDADVLRIKDLKTLVIKFKPNIFMGGTSAGLTFDKKILNEVKKLGAKTIYIFDYWSRYWERFSGDKKDFKYLPDMICVMDDRAKKEMMAEGIGRHLIKITGNPHFDYFQKNIKKGAEDKSTILFVSQPYVEKKKEVGYDEFEVLDDILNVSRGIADDFRVIIRPHPKEKSGKFNEYLDARVKIDDKTPIEKLLSRAGIIVGMNSMVLFQAAVAGKKVISYQPNLKTRDFSISSELGLSKLATTRKDLKKLLRGYWQDNFPKFKKAINVIIPNATKNVINLIKKMDKYEKNK